MAGKISIYKAVESCGSVDAKYVGQTASTKGQWEPGICSDVSALQSFQEAARLHASGCVSGKCRVFIFIIE